MRKLLFIALLAFGMNAIAQISLEHVYPTGSVINDYLRLVKLSSSGYKYVINDTNTITLYNLNHSVFKNIAIPSYIGGLTNSNALHIFYISEELFNTDSTNVEYFIIYTDQSYIIHSIIYDEIGNVLFQKDSTQGLLGGTGYGNEDFISYTPAGTKMIIWHQFQGGASVYSLPGTLPCHDCINGVTTSKVELNGIQQNGGISNPYPNPTANTTRIDYKLPDGINQGEIIFYDLQGKEVKHFKVDRTFDSLLISTVDIVPGTYYYQLTTTRQNSHGKKIVVIK